MARGDFSRLRGKGPVLRILTFFGAAITAILLGAAIQVTKTPGLGDWVFIAIGLPFPFYSVIWCAVAILVLFYRGSYHPGIDIAFDFIGWGANMSWAGLVFLQAVMRSYYGGCYWYCSPSEEANAEKAGVSLQGLLYTSGVIMVLYSSLHLTLFVLGCKHTHERRLRKKRGYTIELDDVEPLKTNAAPPA